MKTCPSWTCKKGTALCLVRAHFCTFLDWQSGTFIEAGPWSLLFHAQPTCSDKIFFFKSSYECARGLDELEFASVQ